jgi:hypothetical protein
MPHMLEALIKDLFTQFWVHSFPFDLIDGIEQPRLFTAQ